MNYLQIIIDGYNFLKTTGMMDVTVSDLELEKSRKRLFGFLMERFPEEEDRKKIVIVFDSQTQLKLPTQLKIGQIDVRFSKGYNSADELIMELIRANHVPKRLLVVSSDHEIQLCAQRRKARFIDSDQWLDELEKTPVSSSGPTETGKKESWGDTDHWLKEFEGVDVEDLEAALDASPPPQSAEDHLPKNLEKKENEPRQTKEQSQPIEELEIEDIPELDDIFPPGYGEDLLDEMEE